MPVSATSFTRSAEHQSRSSYAAWRIAIAEALNLPLATLDEPLSRAKGPNCKFLTLPKT
jgi:hypothetical protein